MSDKLLQKFEAALIDQDVAIRTRKTYLSDLGLFMRWYEGEYGCFKLKQVTTEQIAAYRSWKLGYCKPSTTNRHIVTLKRFFSWAVDDRRLKQSPARKIKFVPEVKPAPRHLSDAEEYRMIATARRHGSARDLALLLTMFHTGLRAMEVCNLRVEDVKIGEASGTLEVKRGKRNKFRVIPLNAVVRVDVSEFTHGGSPGGARAGVSGEKVCSAGGCG